MKNFIVPVTAVIFTLGVVALPSVWSDSDDRWREHDEHERNSAVANLPGNPLYQEECGSCHMAYPPGLLPASSWNRVMTGLEEHFGDNAELDADTRQAVSDFLLANSADRNAYRDPRKVMATGARVNAPLRISETRPFKHEHDEIPKRMVQGNPKVKSFSHCNACHSRAEQGLFNEHDIRIPGYGRWDD